MSLMGMKRVNEIFYSLQGEGKNTGRAAVFIRFSGCNLACPFCDTDFEAYVEMSDEQIVAAALAFPARFVVLTGGEPALQVDASLVEKLHTSGFEIAMESNGTRPVVDGIDWLTVSPKGKVVVERCNELKCIYVGDDSVEDFGICADFYYLQPCDVGDAQRNRQITQACTDYICRHPRWRLSLQTHKLAGFK